MLFLNQNSNNSIIACTTGTRFNKIQFVSYEDNIKLYRIKFENPIYEINKSHCENILSIRGKNEISFLKRNDENVYKKITKVQNPIPFISGIVNEFSVNQFFSLDVQGGFDVWDWNSTSKQIASVNLQSELNRFDNWGQLLYYDRNLFIHADRANIRLLDTRVSGLKTNMHLMFNKMFFETCEGPSCLLKCVKENRVLVGTTHNLLLYDVRTVSKNKLQSPDVRWSHLMSISPSMLKSSTTCDGREIIVAASQTMDDIRMCELNFVDSSIKSSLVKSLKTIEDSYNICKKKGVAINPTSTFHERVKLSRTGIELIYVDKNNFKLFTHTAVGDIYHQNIMNSNLDDYNSECFAIEEMTKLFDACKNITRKIHSTHYTNGKKGVLYTVNNKSFKSTQSDTQEEKPIRTVSLPRWKRSFTDLQTYKDTLAPGILSIWELDLTDTDIINKEIQARVDSPNEIDVSSKISDWLLKNETSKDDINEETEIKDEIPVSNITTTELEDSMAISYVYTPNIQKKRRLNNTKNTSMGF